MTVLSRSMTPRSKCRVSILLRHFIQQTGWTGLMEASLSGHAEVVNTLLQHGASVDLKDEVHLFAVMYNKCFLL